MSSLVMEMNGVYDKMDEDGWEDMWDGEEDVDE